MLPADDPMATGGREVGTMDLARSRSCKRVISSFWRRTAAMRAPRNALTSGVWWADRSGCAVPADNCGGVNDADPLAEGGKEKQGIVDVGSWKGRFDSMIVWED